MKKFVLLFLIFPAFLFAQGFSVVPQFFIGSDSDMAKEDFYDLEGTLRFKFDVTDDIELVFKPELDKYEVDIDEISAKYTFFENHFIKAGKFENILSFDDQLGKFDRIFARSTIIDREIKDQGYVSHAIGLKYEYKGDFFSRYKRWYKWWYKWPTIPPHGDGDRAPEIWEDKSRNVSDRGTELEKDGGSHETGGFAHFIYIPSQFEPQINCGIWRQTKKRDMFAGIFASYYPFVNHEVWGSEHVKASRDNFICDMIYADYRGSFIYGTELTAGSSLINPVGKINFDVDTDYPFFAGADLHGGVRFYLSRDMSWLPALRATVLFPEVSEFECSDIDLVFGNQFTYKKKAKLHIDCGIGIVTKHDNWGDDDLKTKLEGRWAISLVIKDR